MIEHVGQDDMGGFMRQDRFHHAGVVAAQVHAPADDAAADAIPLNARMSGRRSGLTRHARVIVAGRMQNKLALGSPVDALIPKPFTVHVPSSSFSDGRDLLHLFAALIVKDAEVSSFRDLPAFFITAQMLDGCLRSSLG